MDYNYFTHIDDLLKSEPLKAIKSLTKYEENLKNNLIDLHFAYNQMINLYYKHRENPLLLNKCIEVCKKDIEIYPEFKEQYIKDDLNRLTQLLSTYKEFNQTEDIKEIEKDIAEYEYPNLRIPSFQQLAVIYEKQGKYDKAIDVAKLALKYKLDDNTKGGFQGRIDRLESKIKNPPKPLKKTAQKNIEKHNSLEKSSKALAKHNTYQENSFMITFSKSTSKNFNRALYLAEKADNFSVNEYDGQEIYQATFLADNYLKFITLYELIGSWKSTFVFKDGEMLDRKILGQINYCYGDKLRSNSDSFCYGASMFTENPFGCHRLMIHSGQKPWYEWITGEDSRYVYIDKVSMRKQIDEKTNIFSFCPAFNYDNIIKVLNNLPNKIDKNSELYKDLYTHHPMSSITINIDNKNSDNENKNTDTDKKVKPVGCSTIALTIVFLSSLLLVFIF